MAYLSTRKRTRLAVNSSDQLTNFTSKPFLFSLPERQDKQYCTSPSIERSLSLDALIKLRAQEKALQKAKRDEKFTCLQKSIAELLKNFKSIVEDEDNQGTDS